MDKYSDVTEELLLANDHLFQKAQTMDLSDLTLPTFFDRIVENMILLLKKVTWKHSHR